MAKSRATSEDLHNKGLVEVSPGVFQKKTASCVTVGKKGSDYAWVEIEGKVVQKKKMLLVPESLKTRQEKGKFIVVKEISDPITPLEFSERFNQTGLIIVDSLKGGWEVKFDVVPMGKPRMTQSDKWKKRPATDRYWELKNKLKQIAKDNDFVIPDSNYHMIFNIPMPDSWSKKKKIEFNEKPHKQKPDKDNLEKAVLDSLCEEDSYIWDGRVSKYWAYKGSIIIKNLN
jgi:Holliday junction resolvase RusA-like endonuclease